jgi:predicted NUDIX family NTP pyrophosphohydrolase
MKKSAGILLYRFQKQELEVFLVHPGGPFWKNKDAGAWSIPKGEFGDDKEPLNAAIREFKEETGKEISGKFIELTAIKQKAGKLIYAWAVEGDIDAATIQSNRFKMQWPPNSGKWQTVPEVDKGAWFCIKEAMQKINTAQGALINELAEKLAL